MTIQQLTEFLGWTTVINMVILFFIFLVLTAMKNMIMPIHAKILGMSENDLLKGYFQFIAQYKIAIIVFNMVPYIALKIMG